MNRLPQLVVVGAIATFPAVVSLSILACSADEEGSAQADSGPYLCHRTTGPITLDGVLDEKDWARADPVTNFIVPPTMDWNTLKMMAPRPASSTTVARFLWDDDFLYLVVELEDQDLYATQTGHDAAFGTEDVAELFVRPSLDQPAYWEFHVNPRGATRDYYYARRGAGGDARWLPYESGVRGRVVLHGTLNDWSDQDQGWTVEIAIPLTAFERMAPRPKAGDRWRFMVSRYEYSVALESGVELSASAALPRENFHLHEYYPELVFDE